MHGLTLNIKYRHVHGISKVDNNRKINKLHNHGQFLWYLTKEWLKKLGKIFIIRFLWDLFWLELLYSLYFN